MDVLSIREMVACEETAFMGGTTASALMDAAGEALAGRIRANYPHATEFLVLVGKGNNGGDGLVVALCLAEVGASVRVVLTASGDQLGELPVARLDRLRGLANVQVTPWNGAIQFPGSDGVVIDALLGVQAKGALHGTVGQAVARLNAARAANFFRTVALDLPSGLAAFQSGNAPDDRDAAVVADLTLAVGFAKDVLCREALAGWVGRLEVVRWSNGPHAKAARQVLLAKELAGLLPRRNALSNKGKYGRLIIIAGSPGFTGAPVLCSQAALAMGTGLLSVVTREAAADVVAIGAPHEAMVSGWAEGGEVPKVVERASVIVIGPGLGVDQGTVSMLRAALAVGCPVLIDADGLNALAENLDLLHDAKGPVLLTPHPGEMARLIGRKFTPDDRATVARDFVEKHGVTLVLKGTRTLVTAPDAPVYINTTGNSGLSTGGSGDTLSGILGALMGQGLNSLDAARLGVWLGGHAADIVLARRGCEEGMTPTMLSATLGEALVSLRAQAVPKAGLIERARDLSLALGK